MKTAATSKRQANVLGCLKSELRGKTVPALLDGLRGPVKLPQSTSRRKARWSLRL